MYVLELKRNLISLETLDSNGCIMKIDGCFIKVIKDAIILMKRIIQNGLCVLIGHITNVLVALVTSNEMLTLSYGIIELEILSIEALLSKEKKGYVVRLQNSIFKIL